MPVLYLLIFIGIISLWFALRFLFKPIGQFFIKRYENIKQTIEEEKTNDK